MYALDEKNYGGCWGGVLIIDTPYCLHRAQNHMKKNLKNVYTGFNFVSQVGARK